METNLQEMPWSADRQSDARANRRRRGRWRTLAMIALSHGIDALLVFLLYLASAVPIQAFAWQFAGGAVLTLVSVAAVGTHWSERFEDPYLTFWRTLVSTAFQILMALLYPAIALLSITTIFIIFIFGALRLNRRSLLIMWVAVLVGVAATIVALPPDTAFPHASVFQSLLTALWIASTLGRCALVGLYSATIRSKLGERNRKLASTKHLLETMVSRDGLTGAANRTAILDYLDGCLHEQADTVLALVFMDLDHFKLVNDAYGHLVGDRVLRQFVEITMGVLRHDARMGRYGGEEFLLVLPGLPNSEAALAIAERVRTCILEYPWGSIAPSLALTVSAGIAYGKAADTSEAMVKRADAALYAAKSAGRNCTRAEVEMPESADSERRVN